MAIREMDDLFESGLDRAVELMAIAARNSFRFSDQNTCKIIVVGKEELEEIGEYSAALGDMSPLAARDGRHAVHLAQGNTKLMLIGDKRKSSFNYDCGACGYKTCKEMNKQEEVESMIFNGPSCLFRNINVHIATNSAASMAHRLGMHCRVFSTLAIAAQQLEIIENVDYSCSIAVSIADKNPFFDRHEFWTQEFWEETFNKEFPTFNRGFIGAVE